MPRYFFHIDDGKFIPDHTGVDLPDLAAARKEALSASGAMINDLDSSFWEQRSPWNMQVTDERGRLLFTLTFGHYLPSGEVVYRPTAPTGVEAS